MEEDEVRRPTHDLFCRQCIADSPNTHVSWFLMASFAYYFLNESLISDALYDEIYQWLEKNIEQIDHDHKHLIEKDMFSIGSAYYLRDYPTIVQVSAHRLLDNLRITAAPQPRDLWKRKTCPTQ